MLYRLTNLTRRYALTGRAYSPTRFAIRSFTAKPTTVVPNNVFTPRHILEHHVFTPLQLSRSFSTKEDVVLPELNFEKYDVPVELKGGPTNFTPAETFEDMKLSSGILQNIQKAKWGNPTPVQKYAIPLHFQGQDIMSCAQTGSGKTAAFLFPIITRLQEKKKSSKAKHQGGSYELSTFFPLAIVLVPTRELAQQVEQQALQFGRDAKNTISTVAVYGGASQFHQIKRIEKGCEIIAATPGRLNDYIQRGIISLEKVEYLVLDEADRMLDMGFEPQIRRIVEQADMPPPEKRQTAMFSATFPKEIQRLAASFLRKNYVFLTVGRIGAAAELVTQKFNLLGNPQEKRKALLEKLKEIPGRTLVFVETKIEADKVQFHLKQHGFPATSIHGDRGQAQRDAALTAFASGEIQVLVATDVAARGLDVKNIVHVINYDMPRDIDSYVHRIGRTGRAGVRGVATAFVVEEDFGIAKDLVELLSNAEQEVPTWLSEATKRERRPLRPLRRGFEVNARRSSQRSSRFDFSFLKKS